MKETVEAFKQKLSSGVTGIFMKATDGAFIETAGLSGLDFCILDMEHGPATTSELQNLIRACECSGAASIIRVPYVSEESIGKALDLGAAGIQVPQVNSAEAAERAVRYARFYPKGNRGVCRYVRAAGYSSADKFDYLKEANKALIVLQVEGQEGVSKLDEILAVKGYDILFVGPYDLSQSLGVPGEVHHPKVINQIRQIVSRAEARNVTVGIFVDSVEDGLKWKEIGVRYIAVSVDVGIFYNACKQIADELRTT